MSVYRHQQLLFLRYLSRGTILKVLHSLHCKGRSESFMLLQRIRRRSSEIPVSLILFERKIRPNLPSSARIIHVIPSHSLSHFAELRVAVQLAGGNCWITSRLDKWFTVSYLKGPQSDASDRQFVNESFVWYDSLKWVKQVDLKVSTQKQALYFWNVYLFICLSVFLSVQLWFIPFIQLNSLQKWQLPHLSCERNMTNNAPSCVSENPDSALSLSWSFTNDYYKALTLETPSVNIYIYPHCATISKNYNYRNNSILEQAH